MIWTYEELQKEIIRVLKENDGEMKQEDVCDILGIVQYDIPWGYNIGWAKCLQANQKYHLILSSEDHKSADEPPVTLICRATAGADPILSIIKSCPFGFLPIASSIASIKRSSPSLFLIGAIRSF